MNTLSRNPDELDAEAFDLEAKASALHAAAARLRAQRSATSCTEWKPVNALGIARKTEDGARSTGDRFGNRDGLEECGHRQG